MALNSFEKIFNLLSWSPLQEAYPIFLTAILLLTVLGIFEHLPRISSALV